MCWTWWLFLLQANQFNPSVDEAVLEIDLSFQPCTSFPTCTQLHVSKAPVSTKCPCAHWAFSGMIRRAPGKKSQNFKFSCLSFLVWSASNCIDRLKQVLACPTSAANQGVQNQIKTAHQGVKALVESGVLHLGIALTDSVFPEHKFNSLVVGRGWGEPR